MAVVCTVGSVIMCLLMGRQFLVVGIVLFVPRTPPIPGPQAMAVTVIMMTMMTVMTSCCSIVIVLLMAMISVVAVGPVVFVAIVSTVMITHVYLHDDHKLHGHTLNGVQARDV